jgi:uncharacterized protein (DUF1800 family)
MSHRSRPAASVALVLALAVPPPLRASAPLPSDEATIVHALNRLGYGPRPGDVEKVRAMGLSRWIEQQLEPSRISEPVLAGKLKALPTASLSTHDLMKGYEIPPEAQREIQKRRAEMGGEPSEEEQQKVRRELTQKYAGQMAGPPRRVVDELQEAKVIRAVYAERQLDEVMVDFWLNHFNVYAQKGPIKFMVAEYEREVLRPRVFGHFEDLLLATAESPAMLFYLDNWMSSDPNAKPPRHQGRPGANGFFRRYPPGASGDPRLRQGDPQAQKARRGLNENYAREIMELHTLGVDGGYTQKDVTEVARCFTGWTIKGLRQQEPEFHFEPRLHDNGDKLVLGQIIKGAGQDEGRRVIHILATHPSTARFMATKLARRFVADDPPPALVDRAARTFGNTDGNIREVVRTIVTSPEFLAPEARSAKIKTPLEFVVSAVRASGASVDDAEDLAKRIGEMGMPLYMQQPPTGYKDKAEAWVSTSALLARLNFALDLAGGRVIGVTVDATRIQPAAVVPQGLSEQTRKTLDAEAELTPARMAGLVLGSPEFQRR